jgi:chromosomal replication initiation ATPase DnaA
METNLQKELNEFEALSHEEIIKKSYLITKVIRERLRDLQKINDQFQLLKYFEGGNVGVLNDVLPELFAFIFNNFGISGNQLIGRGRSLEIKTIRHLIILPIMEIRPKLITQKGLGQILGGRDHSTIIHSCEAAQNLIDTEPKRKNQYFEIKKELERLILQSGGANHE